jgi:carotenoid cleavage dioxygenase
MVHGIRLEGGQAKWYRNRYVRTPKWEKGLDAMDPETMFDPTASAANTHVLGHAGRIWALEEGHLPWELSRELETIGSEDFGGKLKTAFTAHPKLCPETNELHFFGYSAVAPFLTYHVLDGSGQLVHTADITVPAGTMMHDFMITRDHAIFMDLWCSTSTRWLKDFRQLAGMTTTEPASASCRVWAPIKMCVGSM